MKAEDIIIEAYFTGFEDEDGCYDDEEIESYPGNYNTDDPEGKEFYALANSLVESKVREALKRVWVLFDHFKINSISVTIDAYGDGRTVAACRSDANDDHTGDYVLVASPGLLSAYLKQYWESAAIPDFYELIWDHELLHILDRLQYEAFRQDDDINLSYNPITHLLKYRSEGIADLIYFMKGYRPFKNIGLAREDFKKELQRLISLRWANDKIGILYKALNTDAPYEYGPLMVLHVLSCPGTSLFIPQVPQMLNKIENNLLISDDEIYAIVRHALNITNDAFLEYLTKPGFDGVSFINETELQQLDDARNN